MKGAAVDVRDYAVSAVGYWSQYMKEVGMAVEDYAVNSVGYQEVVMTEEGYVVVFAVLLFS